MTTFIEALAERVLVGDARWGRSALNLTQPELVAEVHQEYVRAGADVIETNTFGANRIRLGSVGLADRLHEINAQVAQIARRASAVLDGLR